MEQQYNCIVKCKEELKNAATFDKVNDISRELFFMKIMINPNFNKFIELLEVMREIRNLLINYLTITKSQSLQKMIVKTIFKFTVYEMEKDDKLLDCYSAKYGKLAANLMSIYGIFQNKEYTSSLETNVLHDFFVMTSLQYSDNTKYFALAIENYTQAYDLKIVEKNEPFTKVVILTNLENAHQNVHKLLLDLFRRVVSVATKNDEIIESVWNMSWYNRNKYYLLSHIIHVRPNLLLNSDCMDIKFFMNGLRIGLSQYHLYSSSLALVKAIYDKPEFRNALIELSAKILTTGSDYEVENFLKLWFTAMDDKFKDELFKKIINSHDFSNVPSTSSFFHRAVIIRNAFGKSLSIKIDNSIKEFCCCVENDVRLKIDMYNFLITEIYKPTVDMMDIFENILRLLKFLRCNMCVEDSFFIDNVMRKLPNFFNHLATNRFRNLDVCREIFTVIRRDLYEHGIEFGSYETMIFSLRMLEVILKQYCGTMKGKSLSKSTNKSTNFKFKQFLKDNQIWDITSSEIFHQLVKMANDTENSDISTTANEILVEYFIKTRYINEVQLEHDENFENWINIKVLDVFNSTDVESYHENISYWKMKFEYSNVNEGIMNLIVELRMRMAELKASKDPVNAIQRGRSLYAIIDCINYSISRTDDPENIIPEMITIMKEISQQFLDFVNDGISCPSFDVLDKNLHLFVESSSHKSNNISEMKHKLLLSIFFTLRSISEFCRTIAKIIDEKVHPHENLYLTTLSVCVEINIQILSRFCHKGVIESACSSLGSITNIISTKFYEQCDRNSQSARNLQSMLIILKQEIDCGKRHKSKTGEIRGSRGFLVMSHSIIRNHKPFLKFLMNKLLVIKEIESFYDTQEIKFTYDVQPIHLHLLAVLVKDSELVEEMLKYYNFILIATFKAYKESKDFIIQNALLQIIGNITPKIANHKRHAIDERELPHYEAKAISVYEFYVKLTYAYRIALFDLEINLNQLSQTYIIILLEIFSNFEFRVPYEYWSEMDRPKQCFEALMNHRCEKIRVIAAKCFAQWHLSNDLPKIITQKIKNIFSTDPNSAHGNIVAVRHMIQRFEASVKCVEEFNKEKFLKMTRQKVSEYAKSKSFNVTTNFFLRCHLLDFLIFLGFKFEDEIITMLMDETKVESKIGFTLWRDKIKQFEGTKAIKS